MALYINYLLSSSASVHDDQGQWKGMMKLKDKVVEEEDNKGRKKKKFFLSKDETDKRDPTPAPQKPNKTESK